MKVLRTYICLKDEFALVSDNSKSLLCIVLSLKNNLYLNFNKIIEPVGFEPT